MRYFVIALILASSIGLY